jgi:hypothetical protein
MYQQYDDLARLARERQAELLREVRVERMLREAQLPKRLARPMRRQFVMALATATLFIFVFAQTVIA